MADGNTPRKNDTAGKLAPRAASGSRVAPENGTSPVKSKISLRFPEPMFYCATDDDRLED